MYPLMLQIILSATFFSGCFAMASDPLEFDSTVKVPPPHMKELSAPSFKEVMKDVIKKARDFSDHMAKTTEVAASYQVQGPHYRVFEVMIKAKPLLIPKLSKESDSLTYALPITLVMRMNGTQMESPEISQLSIAAVSSHSPLLYPERKLVRVPYEEFEWTALDIGYQKNPRDLGATKRLRLGQINFTRVYDVIEGFKHVRVLAGVQGELDLSWVWKLSAQEELKNRLHPEDVKYNPGYANSDHTSASTGRAEIQLGLIIGVWHSIRAVAGFADVGDSIAFKNGQQELSDFTNGYWGASYDYYLNPDWRLTLNWKRENWNIQKTRGNSPAIHRIEEAINTYQIGIKYGK